MNEVIWFSLCKYSTTTIKLLYPGLDETVNGVSYDILWWAVACKGTAEQNQSPSSIWSGSLGQPQGPNTSLYQNKHFPCCMSSPALCGVRCCSSCTSGHQLGHSAPFCANYTQVIPYLNSRDDLFLSLKQR